jgi:hypothetical protein
MGRHGFLDEFGRRIYKLITAVYLYIMNHTFYTPCFECTSIVALYNTVSLPISSDLCPCLCLCLGFETIQECLVLQYLFICLQTSY